MAVSCQALRREWGEGCGWKGRRGAPLWWERSILLVPRGCCYLGGAELGVQRVSAVSYNHMWIYMLSE